VWRRDGEPAATGRLSFSSDVQGTGKSLAAVVAALAGSGALSVDHAILHGIDPGAFARVAAAARAMDTLEPGKIGPMLRHELPRGDFAVDKLTSAFTVTPGTLRANVEASGPAADATASLSLDLARLQLAANAALTPRTAPEDGDPAPPIGLKFSGPLADPQRTVDATPFTGYLTMHAVEREVKKVDAMEARRRQRVEAAKAEADRKAKAAAEAAQAKAAADAAKAKAEEDAAKAKAAEDAAKSAPPPTPPDTAAPGSPPPADKAPDADDTAPPLEAPREIGPPPGIQVIGPPLDTRPRSDAPNSESPLILNVPRELRRRRVPARRLLGDDAIGRLIQGGQR
jgi:hypothetical protein